MRTRYKVAKSQSGMSLVNVMIALGMVGLLMVVIAQLTLTASTSQRYVMQRQESYSRYMGLLGVMSLRSVCTANLQNQPVNGTDNVSQISRAGNVYIKETDTFGDGNLITLEAITINNYKPYVPAGLEGTAELILEFKGQGEGLAGRSFGQSILMAVTLNAGQRITSCVAIGNDIDDIWQYNAAGTAVFYQGTFVGIGTDNPTEMLHVHNGNILADAFLHDSDERLKTNIKEFQVGEDIEALRGVEFSWKESGVRSIGVIAQDVEKVFPELVSTHPETGLKRVSYDLLVVPLLQHQKEMHARLKDINHRQAELAQKLDALSARSHQSQ